MLSDTGRVAGIRPAVSDELDRIEELAAWLIDLFWNGAGATRSMP